jgi:hypothetical protein
LPGAAGQQGFGDGQDGDKGDQAGHEGGAFAAGAELGEEVGDGSGDENVGPLYLEQLPPTSVIPKPDVGGSNPFARFEGNGAGRRT